MAPMAGAATSAAAPPMKPAAVFCRNVDAPSMAPDDLAVDMPIMLSAYEARGGSRE